MKKGIILEKNQRNITVLTPEGEFVHLYNKNQGMIGQEITFAEKDVVKKREKFPIHLFFQKRAIRILALSVAVLLLIFIPLTKHDREIYAYVSLDVNPSIELGINEQLEVVDIIPYNHQAKEVTESLQQWKGEKFQVVTADLITVLEKRGYFKYKDEIIIGTVFVDEHKKQVKQKVNLMIGDIEKSLLTKNMHVESLTGTKNDRDIAVDQGTTAGKLIEKRNQLAKESSVNQQPSLEEERPKSAIEKMK